MGGALGVLGVGYAGRSQRRMRRVNRSAARLSRGGIGDLRVECVKEVSGRVSFSIWGAGAPWERPPTDYHVCGKLCLWRLETGVCVTVSLVQ